MFLQVHLGAKVRQEHFLAEPETIRTKIGTIVEYTEIAFILTDYKKTVRVLFYSIWFSIWLLSNSICMMTPMDASLDTSLKCHLEEVESIPGTSGREMVNGSKQPFERDLAEAQLQQGCPEPSGGKSTQLQPVNDEE